MPSFDIVSQVNSMEIENAVNQARKELANRFDFKASKAEIALEKNEIKLVAEDQFKIRALEEMGFLIRTVSREKYEIGPTLRQLANKILMTTYRRGPWHAILE